MEDDRPMGEMRNLVFTCPVTNQNVQHRFESSPDHDYESVTCLSCGGVHFINCQTGKVLRSG
jgi:RNase P subunit RPR2